MLGSNIHLAKGLCAVIPLVTQRKGIHSLCVQPHQGVEEELTSVCSAECKAPPAVLTLISRNPDDASVELVPQLADLPVWLR